MPVRRVRPSGRWKADPQQLWRPCGSGLALRGPRRGAVGACVAVPAREAGVDGATLWIGSMNFSEHGMALNQELAVTVPVPAGYAAWWARLWAAAVPTV